MAPIVFHASVKGFSSDEIGECKITLKVPDCDKQHALQVGGLTGEVLVVTVMRERDVKAHLKEKKGGRL